MPWWSWLLLWCGLVLGLISVLTWCAVVLYRKALGTLRAGEALTARIFELDSDPTHPAATFTPAVFTDLAELRENVEQQRVERTRRREVRRDALIVRGKLMRNVR
ncbi:hypothetical protein E3O25_01105 [Cryobacterium sp. TMT1-3]|uniref:Uncharacterized protein n=1 Tax=Cryobacterium luteum TaxID=1424661 RepID=A0A1H8D7N0_9MICO|nr:MULTISPECIES: hypothetical protein [Cryobacterium]TFB91924.1 hypothetical protein E3O10_06090 [Cryobacterium luteum]TFC31102.1 hypothetical protein E3O25_01105 [Cryobacterium sp. TMT1-3]SEN03321.1 hypothetical protein SAMN05216281_103174 [Cryobacterium luteum]